MYVCIYVCMYVSMYLSMYVLCAEFLSHVIRESRDVKAIMIHDEKFKVSFCKGASQLIP